MINLFIILLLVITLSSCVGNIVEGLTNQDELKKDEKLTDNMQQTEKGISDDLNMYSNILGLDPSSKDHKDKKHHKDDGSWDDYWGMGMGEAHSGDHHKKHHKKHHKDNHKKWPHKDHRKNYQPDYSAISAAQITAGQEDLYILKSEIVPPVCPACPNVIVDKALLNKECAPCPPCARCPEPTFDCQKVPNYSLGQGSSYLPRPVLNDFSTFGT